MKSDCVVSVVFVLVVSRTCAMLRCLCACLLAASDCPLSLSLRFPLAPPVLDIFLCSSQLPRSEPRVASLEDAAALQCSAFVLRVQGGSGVWFGAFGFCLSVRAC